jgi:hypothetical protein
MDALIAAALWLVPPLALVASYWQIAGAHRLSVLTRNALAIGTTAALVVLIGFDAIGVSRVGPWSAHPHPDWAITVALGAITAAAFAFPTGWSIGTIYQILRARLRQPRSPAPSSNRMLTMACLTLAVLMLAYVIGLGQLAVLAQRAAALRASGDHHPGAPP